MRKLLLSCEISHDLATDKCRVTIKNEAQQVLAPMAVANMIINHTKDAPKEERIKARARFMAQVIACMCQLDKIDKTVIDIGAIKKALGGQDD